MTPAPKFEGEKLARSIVAFAAVANLIMPRLGLNATLNISEADATFLATSIGIVVGTIYDVVGFVRAHRIWEREQP